MGQVYLHLVPHYTRAVRLQSEIDFEDLFKDQYKRLVTVAKAYCHRIELSEEVVQEVFIDFWEKKKWNQEIENLPAYLKKAVVYKSIDVIRKQKRNPEQEGLEIIDDITVSSDLSAEEILISKENYSYLKREIAKLPERTREVFMLSRFEKMSYKEISEQLDITDKTVEYHISKALKTIKESLIAGVLIGIIKIF